MKKLNEKQQEIESAKKELIDIKWTRMNWELKKSLSIHKKEEQKAILITMNQNQRIDGDRRYMVAKRGGVLQIEAKL